MDRTPRPSSLLRASRAPLLISLLAAALLSSAVPVGASAGATAPSRVNIQFEADLPAALVSLTTSADGHDILALDDSATFTFLPGAGANDEQVWTAPAAGLVGEYAPDAIGGIVTPDGQYWAGAIAYERGEEGKIYAFARWSDTPVWSHRLPESDDLLSADQPAAIAAGGPYFAVGTEGGKVYLLNAKPEGGNTQPAQRTFSNDRFGRAFGTVNDVAISRAGDRVLIATDAASGTAGLHLYSDRFFIMSFERIEEPVSRVAMSPDGTRGVAVTGSGTTTRVHLLDLTNGGTIWESTVGAAVRSLALANAGTVLAIGTDDGRALIHRETGDAFDRLPITTHDLGDDNKVHVSASDDGAQVTAIGGGMLLFLDPDRNMALWTYQPGGTLTDVALSSDGESLVMGARNDAGDRILYATADHQISALAPPAPSAAPGQTTRITVALTNTGNRIETVKTVWGPVPARWDGRHETMQVAPGETVDFPLHVTVPSGQPPDDYTIPVTLTSTAAEARVLITVHVPEVQGGRVTRTWEAPVAVPGGAPAGFTLNIENTGNTKNTARLGYSGLPTSWQAAYAGPAESKLGAGEARTVDLKVKAPAGAPIGRDMTFDILVVWDHGEERIPVTIKVVSGAEYRKTLEAMLGQKGLTGDATPLAGELGRAASDPTAGAPIKEKKHDTPSVGIGVAVVGLVALLAIARKRRHA